MITLPQNLEQRVIDLAHRQRVTTDSIIEQALNSLEYDLEDIDDAEAAIAEIESHGGKVLSLDEFNKALAHDLDG